jgi:glycosyltransferase involved in cell wall biosynthesis
MIPISVVIITKNEAEIIADTIRAAKLITDDVIIIDNGSTDQTLAIAITSGCRIYQSKWDGYGSNKNKGIELARYNWILSIDADEVPDMELILALYDLKLDDPEIVYDLKFKSYFGKKRIKYGHWGRDHHIRLFNRQMVRWSEPKVHEALILSPNIKTKKITGYMHHYSVKDITECRAKAIYYAKLSAENYFKAGKKAAIFNLYISPLFGFFVNYILFLGILDGKEGWQISKTIFTNKWLKYHYLTRLQNTRQKNQFVNNNVFVAEY